MDQHHRQGRVEKMQAREQHNKYSKSEAEYESTMGLAGLLAPMQAVQHV